VSEYPLDKTDYLRPRTVFRITSRDNFTWSTLKDFHFDIFIQTQPFLTSTFPQHAYISHSPHNLTPSVCKRSNTTNVRFGDPPSIHIYTLYITLISLFTHTFVLPFQPILSVMFRSNVIFHFSISLHVHFFYNSLIFNIFCRMFGGHFLSRYEHLYISYAYYNITFTVTSTPRNFFFF
jgi:hypothetical protein